MLHEQAIYQHDGECWQVERFDYENHKAFVTQGRARLLDRRDDLRASERHRETRAGGSRAARAAGSRLGRGQRVEKVVGYKKIKFHTHENAGYGDVRLPEMQMHTTAFWLTLPESACTELDRGRAAAIDALRGDRPWRSRRSRRSR